MIRRVLLRRLLVVAIVAVVVPLAWWLIDRTPDDTWPPESDTTATDRAVAPSGGRAPGSDPTGQAQSSQAQGAQAQSSQAWTPRSARIVMGGDLLWHNTVWQAGEAEHRRTGEGFGGIDLAPVFADVAGTLAEADLAICQEEVPFAGPGEPWQNFPLFAAPPQIARWIAAVGFDACVTASNHSIDQGYAGLVETADLLERAGVRHVGTFRTRAERDRPVLVTTAGGVQIGLVAGTYSTNGLPLPQGREWSVNPWDPATLLTQVRAARRAGADLVVVHLHGGNEYDPTPNADQVRIVEELTASGQVDLVLGSHAHVVQPITQVNGVWVVYGMGNMIAQQDPAMPRTYEGILADFTFTERAPGRFSVSDAGYHPLVWGTWPATPLRVQRVVPALAAGRGDPVRLRAALERTRDAVHALGRTASLRER